MTREYVCTFEHQGYMMTVESECFLLLKDGFFIDRQNRLTHERELSAYWIPPSQIKHIKIEEWEREKDAKEN
jgi:hypothetical protein